MAMVELSGGTGDGEKLQIFPALRWLLPLRRRDHMRTMSGGNESLSVRVTAVVREQIGVELDPLGSIQLLTGFGFLWHRFNPVSFYFCRDQRGVLQALVAEVTNTPWHEQSLYAFDLGGQSEGDMVFSCDKNFHVSPFMPMDTRYHWHLRQQGEQLLINIAVKRDGQPLFNATLDIQQRPTTFAGLCAALLRQPLMSLSVVWRIYWQAVLLWFKSTPLFTHPRYSSGDKP